MFALLWDESPLTWGCWSPFWGVGQIFVTSGLQKIAISSLPEGSNRCFSSQGRKNSTLDPPECQGVVDWPTDRHLKREVNGEHLCKCFSYCRKKKEIVWIFYFFFEVRPYSLFVCVGLAQTSALRPFGKGPIGLFHFVPSTKLTGRLRVLYPGSGHHTCVAPVKDVPVKHQGQDGVELEERKCLLLMLLLGLSLINRTTI